MPGAIFSRGPVVSRDLTQLVRLADLSGLGPPEPVSFSHEITWFLEASATAEFRHGGLVVETLARYSDSGGQFMSSMVSSAREAVAAARKFSVDSSSSAEIAVCVTLCKRPGLVNDRRDNAFSPDYHSIPQDWWLDTPETRVWMDPSVHLKMQGPTRVEPLLLFCGDVWSTNGGIRHDVVQGLRRAIGEALGRPADDEAGCLRLADFEEEDGQQPSPVR